VPRRMAHDHWLFFTATFLALAGLFMVGSASTHVALDSTQDPSAYLWKHLINLALGFVGLIAAMSFDYRRLADGRLILFMLGLCGALLILVLAMPAAGGAHRWLHLGMMRFQPSELAKLAAVLFMAYILAKKDGQVNDPWAVPIPGSVVIGSLAFLIFIEPDLGSAVMLVTIACVMVFAAGINWRYVSLGGGLLAGALMLAVIIEPYRLKRIFAFLNPTGDIQGLNFQLQQSFIALGNGGLIGTTTALLLAFLAIFWRGMRAAVRAPDRFGFFLALGITHLIVLQALINMCVCLGLLPTKGLPLPLISYGGSSLLISMVAVGLLLNVSQHSN